MSDTSSKLTTLLEPFGLNQDEAQVYLHLVENGFKSALQISREMHIGRTKVYRIVDKLKSMKLVTERMDDLGMKFGAASYKQLEVLVMEREQELETLRRSKPVLFEQLEQLSANPKVKTEANFLNGEEGLKQALEKTLEAREEILHLESGELAVSPAVAVINHMYDSWRKKKIRTRTLSNFRAQNNDDLNQYRLVESEKMTILFELFVYNETILMVQIENGELLAIEVHNLALADQHRQMFEFVWQCVG